jgi:type IV secretion system protein VirD4
MEALIVILQFFLNLICDAVYLLLDALFSPKGYNAKFGNERLIGSRINKGFLFGTRRLSMRASRENFLLVGVTGSGKSVRVILPNIFSLKGVSMIISDPSMELFLQTSGYLSRYFVIKILNFSDAAVSIGFNLLSYIKQSHDISRIAFLLVTTALESTANSDPFWQIQSINALEIVIELVLYQDKEYHNFANVCHILHLLSSDGAAKVDELIAKTNDKKLITKYKSLISTSERTLQSILSTAKAAVKVFENDTVGRISAHNSLEIDSLRHTPTIIFIHTAISDQKFVQVLSSLFFEVFYGHVLKKLPAKNDLDVVVLLDEASSFRVPILSLALSNTRKMKISTLLAVQCRSQLKSIYKTEADAIVSNCLLKMFLPGVSHMETLREIESLSGKRIEKDEKGNEKRVRPLISADEIRLLPKNRSLIIAGNHPIILGRTVPFYRSLKFRRYAKIPPITVVGDIPDTPVPIINI